MKLSMISFNFISRYKFPGGFLGDGDAESQLIRGIKNILYYSYKVIDMNLKQRKRYRYNKCVLTQYTGKAITKNTNEQEIIICSFTKHAQSTYCLIVTIPKKKYNRKNFYKIIQLWKNIQRLNEEEAGAAISKQGIHSLK